jgi:two-component system sensor histidine kinase/response regulator
MDDARYKVLLIEDDKIDQTVFKQLVEEEKLPYDCTIAGSVSEANSILGADTFDIAIIDYVLGDGTAFDIFDSIKDIPFIIATGAGDEGVAVRAMKAGASDYLIKDQERNYLKVLPVSVENVVKRKKTKEKLKRYDRLKNELAVTVSQELRTSLGIFKGIVSDVMAGRLGVISAQLRKNLEIADKTIDKLAKIISDFLDISKIETGNVQLRKIKVDIQEVVSESIFLLTSLAEEKKVKLSAPFPCDPSFTVYADHGLVRQILVNLIGYTVKFSPMGSTVRITVRDLADEVQIDMQDTSDGIGSEDISKVFNNFIQSDKYAGPGSHGIGLGLYVAKQLVVAQGGRVWAESTPGQGSIFSLALPKYSGQINVDSMEPVEIVQKS